LAALYSHYYDRASDPVLALAFYDGVHQGRGFANIGGATLLNWIGQAAKLDSSSRVVELGSGLGDTCRYLCEEYNCAVAGVDINLDQVEIARKMATQLDAATRERLQFIHHDFAKWTPEDPCDLVFALDSVNQIDELEAALTSVRHMLAPEGAFAVAEVMLGDALTSAQRNWLRDVDGVARLYSPDEFRSMIVDAGFEEPNFVDDTGLALDCFRQASEIILKKERWIRGTLGSSEFEFWTELCEKYLLLFEDRRLTYQRAIVRSD
jgi:SAM-dependent methyltransferase